MKCRGLTLLEVLIATAILAVLAAAVAPLIARAGMLLLASPESVSKVDIFDLAALADAFLAEPNSFGIEETPLHKIGQLEIEWPVNDGDDHRRPPAAERSRSSVTVQAMPSNDPASDHLWLAFTCGDLTIYRWVSIPEDARKKRPTDHGGPD